MAAIQYVLAKLKRTVAGQKVGDLADQEMPATELTSLGATDKVPVGDTSDTGRWKWFSIQRLRLYLQANMTLAATRITGLGSAASRNVGTSSGSVPVLNAQGRLDQDRLGSGAAPAGTAKFLREDGTFARPFESIQRQAALSPSRNILISTNDQYALVYLSADRQKLRVTLTRLGSSGGATADVHGPGSTQTQLTISAVPLNGSRSATTGALGTGYALVFLGSRPALFRMEIEAVP